MQSNSHEQCNIRNVHIINQYAVKKMAYDGKNTRNSSLKADIVP